MEEVTVADETFEMFVQRERTRLHSEREAIFTQQQQLEEKLAEINRELTAIDAYEAAKSGKPLPHLSEARASRAASRAPRARRGSKRDGILHLIKEYPDGLGRGEILEKMGLKGDKAGEMSVSNALTALTKSNQVVRADGKYRMA